MASGLILQRVSIGFRPLSGYSFSNTNLTNAVVKHDESFRPLSGFSFSNDLPEYDQKMNVMVFVPYRGFRFLI